MDLELATTEDIAKELLKRQMRIAFVAIEDTNTPRVESVCFSGKGVDHQDVSDLFEFGCKVFLRGDDETGRSERTYD